MLSLVWADVDLERGWINLKGRNTKSGKSRSLSINQQLRAILDFLRIDANGDDKPADCTVLSNECGEPIRFPAKAWNTAKEKAGLKDFRWHDLRREFGSRFLEAGGHLIQAQQLLGHADPGMTRRYLNLGDETLKAAQNRMTAPMDLGIPESADVSQSLHIPAEVEPDARPVPPRIS